jgi:hypothetical protein
MGVHFLTGIPLTRRAPPAGFGHPLDDLLLPRPCRPYFMPTALLGFHPSKLFLSLGRRPHVRLAIPACRFSRSCRRHQDADPLVRAAASGFLPCESPVLVERGLSASSAGLLPWVFVLFQGVSRAGLGRDSSRPPLTRFFRTSPEASSAASQSIDRPASGLSIDAGAPTILIRQALIEFCAPGRSGSLGSMAFRAMRSPFVESCVAVDLPTILEAPTPCRS